MATSAYLAFTEYDLFTAARWIGLENFETIFTRDPDFAQSMKVTAVYVVASVPLRLMVALALAVLLNRAMRGIGVYRAVMYLPSLLGGSVAVAILWRYLFGGEGVVNQALALVGIEGRNWIASPDTALWTLVVLAIWQFGSPMIIFLAGLQNIPAELTEAARVDGASRWQTFWRVTFPLLTPMVFFNLVMQSIVAFQAFTPAYIISDGKGGPVGSTLFYTLYIFQRAFREYDMGYASALAWVLVAVIAVVTAVNFAASRRWVHYSDG
ncbi:ABC transporter permease [Parenemella sanctibonifatiensis]|uniref:ABC transporter permease n=2 Tax=Parenemella sanctibonifatiensis TaxID=2016505 RepID=A0A255EP90_9ACTN|nr:ABC transporter permease [Parenemella sanctibonifatiensis]